MFGEGSQGSGFHTRNNPKDPYQRKDVIQRAGAIDIRCNLIDVVHGDLSDSESSDYWASLLVLRFRFDPQKRARRITEATIQLKFSAQSPQDELPEVEAISFDGNFSILPSTQSETVVKGFEGNVGLSYGVDLSAGPKWEKTVNRETKDATTISGGKFVVNNIPPNRIAKWTVLENQTLGTGVPTSLRVAVLIKRLDSSVFTCMPTLECKADKWTSLETLFGGLPADDPILLKPDSKPTNKLMTYDTKELGSVDLQRLSDVTTTTILSNALKIRDQ
ncbi:hypothetical protein CGCSCA1_v009710 [Colletotrichum siamense]|nr:hypothetical protein CGCSCA1_v009710 [Colletotrichum siamense]